MKNLRNLIPMMNNIVRANNALNSVLKGTAAMIDDGLTIQEANEYLCDIIARKASNVFKTMKPVIEAEYVDNNTAGYYNNYEGRMFINTKHINPVESILDGDFIHAIECLGTVIHEMKHVQQWLYNPSMFDDYVDAKDNYEAYYNHPSEVQARAAQAAFEDRKNWLDIMEYLGSILNL